MKNFIKFIVWLSSGAVFAWFASQLAARERKGIKVKINSKDRDFYR